MQESVSLPLNDDGPDKGSSGNEARKRPAPPRGRAVVRPQRSADPVIRWLTLAILGVIILWLAGVVSALFFGQIDPAGQPRTAVERDLNYFSNLVQSGKASSTTYAQYIDTLIRAGQLARAQSLLDQLLQGARTDKSYLLAEQAELALANKDYDGVLTSADIAMAEAEKELKAFKDANVVADRSPNAGARMPDSYSTAALAKATALVQMKNHAEAVKAFGVYLKVNPTDSDILVMRALSKVQLGDKKGAGTDYRAALKYIPDYQPALDGLKQIGAAR